MAILMMDSWAFCHGREVAARVAERTGFERLDEETVVRAAVEASGVAEDRLRRLMYGPSRLLDGLTGDRPTEVAALRLALAEILGADGIVLRGAVGHLVTDGVAHVLRACLGASREYRMEQARGRGLSGRDAERSIRRDDDARAEWVELVRGRDFRDADLYDVFVAMQDSSVDEATGLIVAALENPAVARTPASEAAVADARLAARVQLELARKGHDVDVRAGDGAVTVLIKEHTMFLERLQRELVEAAGGVAGVRAVTARPGPRYREPSLVRGADLDVPRKVLLVDDERDFVHTLSERLQSRRMAPTIAYDGEQALDAVRGEAPEVMVLDLKMPGIDGIEVLRRVKREHPETEVIILTGHGSDAEEKVAFELGAFAYLRKPVDIDVLTDTMKAAYRRVAEQGETDGGT